MELSGVELSEVFAVSPKRFAWNVTLEDLARAFVKPKPRRRKNVALLAWGDGGGGASYVVGTLVAAEVPAGRGRRPAAGGRPGGGAGRGGAPPFLRAARYFGWDGPGGAPSPVSSAPSSSTPNLLILGGREAQTI